MEFKLFVTPHTEKSLKHFANKTYVERKHMHMVKT